MRLYIIRHGETEGNTKHIFNGRLDTSLTEKGLVQAQKLARRLKDIQIDIVISSPLSRARDTAKEILKYHPETQYKIDERIIEADYGAMSGQLKPEKITWETFPKDAETYEEMKKRGEEFLDEIRVKYPKKNVLLSSHGLMKIVLLSILTKEDLIEFPSKEVPNTAFTEFEIFEDGKHKIHCLNCAKHLDE